MRRALIAAAILAAVTAHGQHRPFAHGISQTEQVTRGLVSYWSMRTSGTTVYDEKSGLDGTARGSPTFSTGNGVVQDGMLAVRGATDKYFDVTHNAALSLTTAFTISAWVNPSDITNAVDQTIVEKSNKVTANPSNYGLRILDSHVRLTIYAGGYREAQVNSVITAGQWQHVVVMYVSNADNAFFYINGTMYTVAFKYALAGNTQPVYIGGTDSNVTGFNGFIDEVRIYNVALTAEEIHELYRMGAYVYANR